MLHSLNSLPSATFNPHLNWLGHEENPYGLAGPPAWFLQEMWTFDPCLVIFPSREEPIYRLARRVEHGSPLFTFLKSRPDTKVFVRHRLVPVTSILPPPLVQWGPVLLRDLAERDVRRAGGYRKAADLLDRQDDDRDARWRAENDDGASVRARASWREQKWSHGEALDLGGRQPEGARTSRARRIHDVGAGRPGLRPSAGTFAGALFIGRSDHPQHEATPFLDADAPMPYRGSVIMDA